METFGLRRTQSLKSLSGGGERSLVMSASTRWERKSVFQLVQQYQSCSDLTSIEKEDHKLQSSEGIVDSRWRRSEGRESISLSVSGGSSKLWRSRSMEVLPQKESSGTKALCALFESKVSVQESFSSSQFNSTPANSSKMGKEGPLQDWRGYSTPLKDTNNQRNSQEDGGKVMNGLPESYDRSSRYSHDDKYAPSLTQGGSPSRLSRDRISLSSSVRDRSALYLSRAAAADSTGGSTHTEVISTQVKRTKTTKFLPPAQEMCSACLTPVYPMEKMVANKLVLHKSCFCCKYCKKKLSIRNHSSLYGEFYCNPHYQQLFKRKGNYDEGFGHKQHKDHWIQKNKGTDEPDAVSVPKTTKSSKSNLKTSGSARESSAHTTVTKSSVREVGSNGGADVKGKLKMSWPPEKKKSPGVNPSQQTYVESKTSDIRMSYNKSGSGRQKGDTNQSKISHGGETKDRVKTLSSSFASVTTVESNSTVYNSSKETKPKRDPVKAGPFKDTVDSITPRVLKFSMPTREKGITAANLKPEQKNVTPTSKTNHSPVLKRQDSYPNKAKKSVRFSHNIDVAQYDVSTQLSPGHEDRNGIAKVSEEGMINQSKEEEVSDNIGKHSVDLSFEGGSEVYLEIPEYKGNNERSMTSMLEPDVKVESSQEIQQAEEPTLSEAVEKAEESVATVTKTEEVVTRQQAPEMSDINPTDLSKSENHSAPTEPEAAKVEGNKNQLEMSNSTNDDQGSGSQRKQVLRTNSLKGSAQPSEKPKAKLGSWSKGKSPLSKLFTSGGGDKTTKGDSKDAKKPDAKPGGGLLGRLFQSSSGKVEETTKEAAQDEKTDKTSADGKTTTDIKEPETEGTPNKEDVVQEPVQKQKDRKLEKKESNSAEADTEDGHKSETESKEPSGQLKTSTGERPDEPTTLEQNDESHTEDQDSNIQKEQSTGPSIEDPKKGGSEDLPVAAEPESEASKELGIHSTQRNGSDQDLKNPFDDDILGDSFNSATVDPFAIQVNAESTQTPNGLLDAPGVEEQDLFGGGLLDTNYGLAQGSNDPFGSPHTHEFFTTNPPDPFSVGDTTLSEAALADTFNLLDSKPDSISAETEEILGVTDHLSIPDSEPAKKTEDQSPFSPSSETKEQEPNFDIFSSNDFLFTPSPSDNTPQGVSSNQPSAFPDDIFGASDVSGADAFAVLPPTNENPETFSDLLGTDPFSSAAPSAQTDLFADSIFTSEPQLLPASEPGAVDLFGGGLLVSDNIGSEQKTQNTVTDNSWMDDLLG